MDVHFTVAKRRLKNLVRHPVDLSIIERSVILAHEATKRALFFLKAYSLHSKEIPKIENSTLLQCLNYVGEFERKERKKTQRL